MRRAERAPATGDLAGQGGDDHADDVVLHGKDILDLAVIAFGPQIVAGFRFDQLDGNAELRARAPDAAFHHIMHAEFTSDLAHIHGLSAIAEGGIAGNDMELAEAREFADDVFGDAVAEVGLFGIAAEILERQHGDRRPVRQRRILPRRRRDGDGHCAAADADAVDLLGLGAALELMGAKILHLNGRLAAQIAQDRGGDVDIAGSRDLLQAPRQIDVVAIDVLRLDDDVAGIDPHAIGHAPLLRQGGQPFLHLLLHGGGAFDGLHGAVEAGEKSVAGRFDYMAAVSCR